MLIHLFTPPKPPKIRAEHVSVTHTFMNDEPRFKPDRIYRKRTAQQNARRLQMKREAERIRRQLKRRQSSAARKMRAVAERLK